VLDDVPDRQVLGAKVGLEALACTQHGLRVQVGLRCALVRRAPDDLPPDHDHEHRQQLQLAGQEQQERVGVRVEPKRSL
jgi:hypothetical protein